MPSSVLELLESVDTDPEAFFKVFLQLNLRNGAPSAEFHSELFRLLKNSHRVVIAAPRAHAKSTICSFAYPIWAAVTGYKDDIIIVSKTASLAEWWLDQIKEELGTNEAIIKMYGKQRSNPWRSDQIKLQNGNRIYAKGSEFQIRGYRPSCVILDDLEDEESVRSLTQNQKLEDWLLSSLINVLDQGENNQLIMIGNYIGPACLLKALVDRCKRGELPQGWQAREFHATVDSPVWPEKWDSEALKKRREEIGSVRFASEFENNPAPEGMTLFQEKWFRYWESLPTNLNYFIAVDTADSLKKTSDYSCVMVIGVDANDHLYVVKYDRGHFSPQTLFDKIISAHQRYGPLAIGVEAHTWKNNFSYSIRKEMQERNYHFPFRHLTPVRDPVLRASPLAAKMEAGRVFIHRSHTALIQELTHYPYRSRGVHDDTVDALAYANKMAIPASKAPERQRQVPEASPLGQLLKAQNQSAIMQDVIFDFDA